MLTLPAAKESRPPECLLTDLSNRRCRPAPVVGINRPDVGFAATAVGRCRGLDSRSLAQSCHRLTQQHGGINDRYRKGCSHPARQATVCTANSRSNVHCTKGRTHALDPFPSYRPSIDSPGSGRSELQGPEITRHQTARHWSLQNFARTSFLRSLPTALRGRSGQNSTDFGAFALPTCSLHKAINSASSTT